MKLRLLSALILTAILVPTGVQANSASEYKGQENREIKSLPVSERAALVAGKGMGFAKVAELNGYPGPAHVLELASQLKLSQKQHEATQKLFDQMLSRAKSLGVQLIEAERRLDELFRLKKATPESATAMLVQIGELRGKLRAVHVTAHLNQVRVLSDQQIAAYNQLRGYAHGHSQRENAHHHKH